MILNGLSWKLTDHSVVFEIVSTYCILDSFIDHDGYSISSKGFLPERSNPMSKELWLRGCRRAERSYSTFKVRRGGNEEMPLIQSKEQWLHFAGAAMKRYPTSKVRETQVRW